MINQAYLENGTNDQIVKHVKHLVREMELNGLEADEPSVKTQMTVTKKNKLPKNLSKITKKFKIPTPKTVLNKTLKKDRCHYCKETGHKMTDFLKLAKRR